MGVLSEVLRYKQQQEAQQRADIEAIPNALLMFEQARQHKAKQNLETLTALGTLAAKGIVPNDMNNPLWGFKTDPNLLQAAQRNVYALDDQGNLSLVNQIGGKDIVKQLPQSTEQIAEKAKARGNVKAQYFQEGEITDIRNLNDLKVNISMLKEDLKSLDIVPGKFGEIQEETINSPMGPISVPARFNLAGQYMKDPKYTAAKNKMERLFQSYRKVITGAQASDKELRMLRPLIASFKDRPEVFFANLDSTENEANALLTSRFDMYDAFGRDTTKLRELYTSDSNKNKGTETNSDSKVGGSFQGKKILSVRKK